MAEADNKQRLENFKGAIAATLRAMGRKKEYDVTFSTSEKSSKPSPAYAKNTTLPLPDLNVSAQDRALIRGASDAKALELSHHSDTMHHANAPMDLTAKAVFDALERARVEAIGANQMAGVKHNLNAVLDEKFKQPAYQHIQDRDDVFIGDAVHAFARFAMTGEPVPDSARALIGAWQGWISEHLGKEGFEKLVPHLQDQKEFAKAARQIIEEMGIPLGDPVDEENPSDDNGEDTDDAQEGKQDQQEDEAAEESDSPDSLGGDDAMEAAEDTESTDQQNAAGMEETSLDETMTDSAGEMPAEVTGQRPEGYIPGPEGKYFIYTTQFDEEIKAEELTHAMEMARLRDLLDKQMGNMSGVIAKLANRLQRKLMARQQRNWEFNREEGVLDASRLSKMIANPNVNMMFKQEKESEFRDTLVTLLIDNSGSMRGRPIAIAAMCADVLARTLERCSVKVEILGFTTKAWKGGQSRDLWIENGRPDRPGRLNDLRHIIYKAADAPFRRARKNLGLMLKEGLLKENIDGEALAWAYNRIVRRPEQRKIIMVISDGAPVDDSTLSVNPSNVLERDLRNIISWIEAKTPVELTAIGIGHDVTRYYSKAVTITDADDLGPALISRLEDLFHLEN